jgi:type IV pilus assembly protein PilB
MESSHKAKEDEIMAERRTIGQILMDLGRITESDVARALQHQQRHGGFFGEALTALEIVTQEELEWTLASQFDIPYVFPDADSIDLDAAALVTPEWALANLTLPIMKTAEAMMVIVDSPVRTAAVDDIERMAGLRIELALASSGKIRELIRQVYARIGSSQDRQASSIPGNLTEFIAVALEQGAQRFGVSLRGHRATGWYETPTEVQRGLLTGTWDEELDRLVTPSLAEQVAGRSKSTWSGKILSKGIEYAIAVSYMSSQMGKELLFARAETRSAIYERFPPPSAAVLSEVNLLVRSGSARFAVTSSPSEIGKELLPHLPDLLLDPTWRTVHLRSADPGLDERRHGSPTGSPRRAPGTPMP